MGLSSFSSIVSKWPQIPPPSSYFFHSNISFSKFYFLSYLYGSIPAFHFDYYHTEYIFIACFIVHVSIHAVCKVRATGPYSGFYRKGRPNKAKFILAGDAPNFPSIAHQYWNKIEAWGIRGPASSLKTALGGSRYNVQGKVGR